MSRSAYEVTFPDGTVRYGLSNDTVGLRWPALFDTAEQAWEGWELYRTGNWAEHTRFYYPDPVGDPEPVTVADPLLRRVSEGRATRNRLIEPLEA